MTEEEFVERAKETNGDWRLIDNLCIGWLESKAAQWGKNGRIAVEALKIFRRLTEN